VSLYRLSFERDRGDVVISLREWSPREGNTKRRNNVTLTMPAEHLGRLFEKAAAFRYGRQGRAVEITFEASLTGDVSA
jgi:hypothetical protein